MPIIPILPGTGITATIFITNIIMLLLKGITGVISTEEALTTHALSASVTLIPMQDTPVVGIPAVGIRVTDIRVVDIPAAGIRITGIRAAGVLEMHTRVAGILEMDIPDRTMTTVIINSYYSRKLLKIIKRAQDHFLRPLCF
jgi:hypothetical protein